MLPLQRLGPAWRHPLRLIFADVGCCVYGMLSHAHYRTRLVAPGPAPQDVASADAGALLGLTNTASILGGIAGNIATGLLLQVSADCGGWRGGVRPRSGGGGSGDHKPQGSKGCVPAQAQAEAVLSVPYPHTALPRSLPLALDSSLLP